MQKLITHTGFPADSIVQDYARYAYKISNNDLSFVIMMECENGDRDTHRWGDGGKSLGLCQMHKARHKEVYDPNIKSDWKLQIRTCLDKYKDGTKFYGPDRPIAEANGMLCKNYVKKRFLIK